MSHPLALVQLLSVSAYYVNPTVEIKNHNKLLSAQKYSSSNKTNKKENRTRMINVILSFTAMINVGRSYLLWLAFLVAAIAIAILFFNSTSFE